MKNKIVAMILILIFSLSILSNSALANLNNTSPNKSTLEKYYTYDELTLLLGQLKEEYPNIFDYSSLGKTWGEKDIWLVKISDNVSIEEDEGGVLYIGGMHGDEHQGYQTVIYSIISILENYTSVKNNESFTKYARKIVNNTQMFFIPMLNADGCIAKTRKNFRPNGCLFGKGFMKGVDVNRNSGYKWELQDKYPFRFRRVFPYFEKINIKFPLFDFRSIIGEGCYRGPEPFSEPESQAIKHVVENYNISIYIDHHGAVPGGMIMYGWSWNHNLEYQMFLPKVHPL